MSNRYIQVNYLLGKSSISIQFTQGQFPDCYEPTIENSKH